MDKVLQNLVPDGHGWPRNSWPESDLQVEFANPICAFKCKI